MENAEQSDIIYEMVNEADGAYDPDMHFMADKKYGRPKCCSTHVIGCKMYIFSPISLNYQQTHYLRVCF